jgi:hypothetical protein
MRDGASPLQYRLTHRPSGRSHDIDPTNDWRKIRCIEEAEVIAARARKERRRAAPQRAKK